MIKNSSIRYHHPVRGMIRAICQSPDEAMLSAFQTKFREKGRAGIRLQVTLVEDDKACVEFEGVYVAVR